MDNRIKLATVSLHISAGLYAAVACLLFGLTRDPEYRDDLNTGSALVLAAFSLALAAGVEVVAFGLRRRKFWAWIAGLWVFAVYLPSLFFPLGALGLWGLLDAGSRAAFGVGRADDRRLR